ncbi:21 kDa subunit of NADH dehydrogenase [Serendipita vermifera]|nr:21 kDa subunit of NADH dehydrogenase [Serendipita vermifera]
MATKKAADHTLYHLSPRGFWKKFRDVTVVNPEISSGLPLPDKNRYPPPGSRPERYSTPATMASDVAQNPYWKRDVRRAYPRLSVVTQEEFGKILIASPEGQKIAAPGQSASSEGKTSVPTTPAEKLSVMPLSEVIGAIYSAQKAYSETNLPPTPVGTHKWVPTRSPDPPHDPHSYWPMKLYS